MGMNTSGITPAKSFDRVRMLIISIGLASVGIIALSAWVIYVMFHWNRVNQWKLILLATFATVLVWAVQSWLLYASWKASSYEIGPEFVTVTTSQGIFALKTTSYRYESMISVSLRNGIMGKTGPFSEIHIGIPRLNKAVVIKDLQDPHAALQAIQSHLNERGSSTGSLVN